MKLSKDKVSVIIVNRNRDEILNQCLKSLMIQDYPIHEIIVIDNNSDDGSCEMIEKNFPRVILIKNKINLGACIAKNQGIKISNGDYIWFLDNDSLVIKKNTLSSMIKIIKQKNVGAVGGELWIEENIEKGIKKRVLLKNGESLWEYSKIDNIIKADYLSTANFLVKKEILYLVKGFNPIYFYLYEDIDISYKIKGEGLNLISSKNTLIHHREIKDKARITNFFRLNKNRIIFMILNFNLFYLIILPILDIYYLFSPEKIKILKEKSKSGLNKKDINNKSINSFFKAFKLGIEYIKGLIFSYLWVIFNLYKIIKSKNKQYI